MRQPTILALVLATLAGIVPAFSQQDDVMLSTLRKELDYNYKQLREQKIKPYFMSYRVNDTQEVTLVSEMGVTAYQQYFLQSLPPYVREAAFTPLIRIGSYQVDNMKFSKGFLPRGKKVWALPYDASATYGITTNIWAATLSRYNDAVNDYEKVREEFASNKSQTPEDSIPSFSQAPVTHYYEAPLPDNILKDTALWQRRLNTVTTVFRAHPWLTNGTATMKIVLEREYLVNTDGTEVVQNHRRAYINLVATAYAKDGWRQSLNHTFFAFNPDSLPSDDVMAAKAEELVGRVRQLVNAPRGEAYAGPAILSGEAAGVLFHEVLGHRIEGHRYGDDAETFSDMVGEQVLPKSFNVVSDPTLFSLNGLDLNGAYRYDEEGVKAQRVEFVKDGRVHDLLMSRIPGKHFRGSNGHGRAAAKYNAVARQSNLIATTTAPVSNARMREELIAQCRHLGKSYGYYIKTVNSGYTLTGEEGSINSFKVQPVESYRVYVDGRPDELVRDLQLIGTPLNMFSDIVAGGSELSTFVGQCRAESGWVPVTSSAPSILVSKLETQAGGTLNVPQRQLDAPAITENVTGSDSTVIFRAMADEMKRQMDSLEIDGQRPFVIESRVDHCRTFSLTSELGALSVYVSTPYLNWVGVTALAGDNKLCEGERFGGSRVLCTTSTDYLSLRRSLNNATGQNFYRAVQGLSALKDKVKHAPLPPEADTIPARFSVSPISYSAPVSPCPIDEEKLKGLANRLSAMFLDCPHLYNTLVKIDVGDRNVYTLTTEGVRMIQPVQHLSITVSANYRSQMENEDKNSLWLSYRTVYDMPSEDSLKSLVKNFIADCEALRKARYSYNWQNNAPVMLEDWVVFQLLRSAYADRNGLFAKPGQRKPNDYFGERIGFTIADRKLSLTHYTNLSSWNGQPLYGHYKVDATGVRPAPSLVLIKNGVLRHVLSGAAPGWYCMKSTGTQRFYDNRLMSTLNGFGTIAVTTDRKLATPQHSMEKKLIELGRKQGLENVYIISQPENITKPRLYKVNVKTGKREMEQSNRILVPTLEQLKKLLYVSDQSMVANYAEPYTFSFVYPKSIILSMSLRDSQRSATPAPVLTYPLLRKK